MAFAGSVRAAPMSGINITPLVDVLLVLLIIFMIAAPLLSRTLPLDLGHAPPDGPEPPPPLQLRIGAEGQFVLQQVPLSPRLLGGALHAAQRLDPRVALQVSVAPEARYQQVALALASARNAGISAIGLAEE